MMMNIEDMSDEELNLYTEGFKYGVENCYRKRETGFCEYVFNLSAENWQNPVWKNGYEDGWKMLEIQK